jgi:hypothetical protein
MPRGRSGSVVRLLSQPTEVRNLYADHRANVIATTEPPAASYLRRRARETAAKEFMAEHGRGLLPTNVLPSDYVYSPHELGVAKRRARQVAAEVSAWGEPEYNVLPPAPPDTYIEYDRRGRPKSVCDRFTNMCYSIGSFFGRGGTRRIAKRSKKYSRKT